MNQSPTLRAVHIECRAVKLRTPKSGLHIGSSWRWDSVIDGRAKSLMHQTGVQTFNMKKKATCCTAPYPNRCYIGL